MVLTIIVFVHELGHFLAAKKAGVKVEEFAFGFPPRLFSKKIGETKYGINLIPLGGYVRLHGEDGENYSDPKSFYAKKSKNHTIIKAVSIFFIFITNFL